MKSKIYQIITYTSICFLFLNACAPVHRLTRIKKTPYEYVRNYCCGEVAVSHSLYKRGPWVVYSDRDNNTTYYNPGGKVPLKKAAYLEPFVVIGSKGDFLRLVKYSPKVIENGRIKNRKQAEYYGWIHRDNLLLSSHATTDIATGNSIKMITMIKDGKALSRSSDFFSADSLIIYKDPELLTPCGKIPFQMPVYQVKKSRDRSKTMIMASESIDPDSTSTVVSGWVSSSLVMPLGGLLYMDYSSLPVHSFLLYNQKMEETLISNDLFSRMTPTPVSGNPFSLNPVSHIQMDDSLSIIETSLPMPVMDNRNNFIYSLSGKKIWQSEFKGIEKNLRNMNIVFVFSGQRAVYNRFEQLVSSLQGIRSVLETHSPCYSYRLGAVIGFDKSKGSPKKIALNDNIDNVLAELEHLSDRKNKITPHSSEDAWDALRTSVDMLASYRRESNLIILIGENGNGQEHMDASLINNLADHNCRFLAYQLSSDDGNNYNNFVLQVEHLVKQSAKRISEHKRDILVHSEQLRETNQYIEQSDNIYRLDYPQASMTQGWIVFPRKREDLPADLLISSADSLIREIRMDNKSILSHLRTAFFESGTGRTRLDSLWLDMQKLPQSYSLSHKNYKALSSLSAHTNFPLTLRVPMESLNKGHYFLLLSESELNNLRNFMADLTRLRVDYKYVRNKRAIEKREGKICEELPEYYAAPDTMGENPQYLSTRKVRSSLLKTYYYWIRFGKIYPMKKGDIKRMSLSEAQQEIFTMPSFKEELRNIKVGDLVKKNIVTDVELDHLLDYLLKKRKELEDAIIPENQMKVNGQIFYKIDATKLP